MPTHCVIPGCTEPRWAGPSGTNHNLTKCETHQKADWREYKLTHPRKSKSEKQSHAKKQSKRPAPAAAEPKRETVKALVVDRLSGRVYRGEMEITSARPLAQTRQLETLIEFYRATGHVI